MMTINWLVVDVNNVCHRNFHAIGNLSYEQVPTGVLFGFFRDIISLKEKLQIDRMVFCFDSNQSKRAEIDSTYKARRREKYKEPGEELEMALCLHQQIKLLRTQHLPRIGFRNIFFAEGYEADDLIASFVLHKISTYDEIYLLSTDKDLYQLLNDRVMIWNPHTKQVITKILFYRLYKIKPFCWWSVKAIAGCRSDEVKGIKGVGEKTAIKYLRGGLSCKTKAWQGIMSEEGQRRILHNRDLVRLPFAGCPMNWTKTDEPNLKEWKSLLSQYGIKSLEGKHPFCNIQKTIF